MKLTSKKRTFPEPAEARVESLAQDGRGVAHINGKAIFIHNALPNELVRFAYERVNKRFDEGRMLTILEASPDRVSPLCGSFGICGGCSLQHLQATAQIHAKEQILRDALEHIGKVEPDLGYVPPLVAGHWGYRGKARLGAKYVTAKGRLLVGFRERNSSFVTDLASCEVLNPKLGHRIELLREVLAKLSLNKQIPQIELSAGDAACAIIIRVLAPPEANDLALLSQFGRECGLSIYLQPGGPNSLQPLDAPADLSYSFPDLGLCLRFNPLDFTQINLPLNRLLVARVLELLDPQPHDLILDLFCGIGNFTLPLATRAGAVIGVEGDAGLVDRAKNNALMNGLNNCDFCVTNLYSPIEQLVTSPTASWLTKTFDKILLDPPRSGAMEILPYFAKLGAQRILYISCFPATLARDADILVHKLGYQLRIAGVMDMFPHTTHVESLALFERR